MRYYEIGKWTPIEDTPDPDPDKCYVVTALFDCCAKHRPDSHRLVMDCMFRYIGKWEFYAGGEWHEEWNPNYKPIAYAEIHNLEPWDGDLEGRND